VTAYRLVFEGLDTARIRPEDGERTAPLAWFRVTYVDGSNETSAVHVYGHHEQVSERPWRPAMRSRTRELVVTTTGRGGRS
jgi:hypothetical protein